MEPQKPTNSSSATTPPAPAATAGTAVRRRVHLPRSRSRRFLFSAVYLAFLAFLGLGGIKFYWWYSAGVPVDQTPTVWDHYFPQLRTSGLRDSKVTRDDDSFDVLLLGGSVLVPSWGHVEADLKQELERSLHGQFRIFNLAESGFTSRDSLILYESLANYQFDLVIVYDGINDVRMNCCPPEQFRDDYTHFSRYAGFSRRIEAGTMSLSEAALDRWTTVSSPLSLGTPDPQLLEYAAVPQTPRTLSRNLEQIVELASERHDPLLILTYAWYLPENYSAERFARGELDYANESSHPCGVEMWGKPEHVVRAISEQNEAIRQLVNESNLATVVDVAKELPSRGENFVDICHLTRAGSRRFVEIIWPSIESHIHRFASTP